MESPVISVHTLFFNGKLKIPFFFVLITVMHTLKEMMLWDLLPV